MSIVYQKVGNILKITIPAEPAVQDFEELKLIYNKEKHVEIVRLDLKNCYYIQSKHLSKLVALKKFLMKDNVQIELVNVNESILQVLEITGLVSQFIINRDYSSYSIDELFRLFLDPEAADEVSDFIVENYNEKFKESLLEGLNSEDPVILEYAIVTLGKVHEVELKDKISKFMDHEVANVQKAAIIVAGWLGIFELKKKIYTFLTSDFIDVAEAAAASIALLSDEEDAEKLKDFLYRSDERLRKIAVKALALINDDRAFQILLEAIDKEKNEEVKAVMTKSLSLFNKQEVGDNLIKLLKDSSVLVRETAASSLSRINPINKTDKILEYVDDTDEMVSYFAIKALGNICRSSKCADKLVSIYGVSPTIVKAAIIEALGKIGVDVSDFIYQIMDDENEDLRKEALNALFMLNKKLALEVAKDSLENDKSWVVRFKAAEILSHFIDEKTVKDVIKGAYEKEKNKYVKNKLLSLIGEA
jgi:HEAT repeat protein/anti-anti-sigma regulatory factor